MADITHTVVAEDISHEFAEIQQKLGISNKLFDEFTRDSEWSFTIKVAAVCEVACNHLLSRRFEKDPGSKLSKISFRQKVDLIDTQGWLSDGMIAAMKWLQGLRNFFAHDIRKVDYSIDDYLKEKPDEKPKLEKWVNKLYDGYSFKEQSLANSRVAVSYLILLLIIEVWKEQTKNSLGFRKPKPKSA